MGYVPVGGVFEYNGRRYRVCLSREFSCARCCFSHDPIGCKGASAIFGWCIGARRPDGVSVYIEAEG